MMRNEKGITLISLVITIILLLILATIGINSGVTTIKSSKLTKFTTELKIMQTEVNELYNEWKNEKIDIDTIGQEVSAAPDNAADKVFTSSASGITDSSGYRYYDSNTIKNNLQIDGIENEFFVNVEKRSVVATEGIEVEGKMCYTLDQIPDGLYNVEYIESTGNVEFEAVGQVISENKGKITVSNIRKIDGAGNVDKWQIRYRVKGSGDDAWKTTDEFTGSEYSFEVEQLEIYEIQVFHGDINSTDIKSGIKEVSVGKEKPPEESTTTKEIVKTNGVIEVEFLSDTSYTVTDTPNKPILKDGMKAVYWAKDASGEVDENNPINNTYEITSDDPNFKEENWYNYIAQSSNTEAGGTSRWANAKTSDGSYYVWIPRYAYRIVYFANETDENEYRADSTKTDKITGYSDARGIVDKDGKRPQDVPVSKTGISVNSQKFRPHPAFDDNVDEGGWDSKLTGIWVMKFEASREDASATSEGSSTSPKSVPGVQSWRNTTIGDMFTYAKNAYNKEESVVNEVLNSHMMKNSEWGAVAYLTDSEYGRNGTEVTINNSSSYITGSAGNSVSAAEDVGTTNDYKSVQGALASTTGNVYGIYDLSGGAYDYTSAYYIDGDNTYLNYGSSFTTTKKSDKYSTVYNGTSVNSEYIPGDVTFETLNWNLDDDHFPNNSYPFSLYGGVYQSGSIAGIFDFGTNQGMKQISGGFRVSLIIK